MTLTVITTSSLVTGVAHAFTADGDALYLREGVIWGSRDDNLYSGARATIW